jgi:hypothetical protein
VFDPVGGPNFPKLISALAFQGTVYNVRAPYFDHLGIQVEDAPRPRQCRRRTPYFRAAIHTDGIAGDPTRVSRGEERHNRADIIGLADPLERLHAENGLFATQPAVVKTDYAKWMLDDARVNSRRLMFGLRLRKRIMTKISIPKGGRVRNMLLGNGQCPNRVKGGPSTTSGGLPDYAPQTDLPTALSLVSEVP